MQQWNEVYKKEGKVFEKMQENIPEISSLFRKNKVKRILDLGCGYGRHIVYFAKHGFDVYGIDIAQEGLKIAGSWLKKENLKVHLKHASIYKKLPYPDDFFDTVVSIRVIHHSEIKEVRKTIKEIERVLKPNGLIFITVPKSHKTTRFKTIAPRTYVPIEGREKGLAHYLFNKTLIKKEFRDFRICKIWIDFHRQYCFIGELKSRIKKA